MIFDTAHARILPSADFDAPGRLASNPGRLQVPIAHVGQEDGDLLPVTLVVACAEKGSAPIAHCIEEVIAQHGVSPLFDYAAVVDEARHAGQRLRVPKLGAGDCTLRRMDASKSRDACD